MIAPFDEKDYEKFREKFAQTFLQLRNHKALILNLIFLMIHAGMPNLALKDH